MNFNRFDVKTIKTFELGRKTTKVIKLQWIASIWRQNDQNFWVTSLNYKVIELQLIASIWCQNDQECWVTSQNIQNNAKLRKSSNYNELHRFDVKTITTTQNYESDQIIMHCIDLTSKRSRMLRYVAKHSKQRKTTNEIKLQWIWSIWHQNDLKCWVTSQNYKCDHITMNLHRFDVKTITTTHNYEIDQIIMHCINLTSKRSKKLSYVPKLQKWSNYNELHRFDVKTIKNVELRRKTFKTTQNYESHQITMNCIDLTSERSKMLSYVAKLQMWSYYDEFASIWRQNDNNNSKLRKWSNYNALHQFDVKTI